jgi:hypothetical protein
MAGHNAWRHTLTAASNGGAMPTIYISDSGDDKNDGLSLKTPIYSLKRAKKLQGGKNDYSWHFGPRAWKRIEKELADKKK